MFMVITRKSFEVFTNILHEIPIPCEDCQQVQGSRPKSSCMHFSSDGKDR